MDQPYRIVTHRTTLKFSTDLTEEEYRQAIAKATNKPLDEVPALDSETVLAKMKEHSQRVEKITENYKAKLDSTPKINQDKYDELNDIGKFIIAANDEPPVNNKFALHVPDEIGKHPDFVLTYGEKKIGVEHTRLSSEEIIQIYKAAKNCLRKAEGIIAKDLSHLSKTVNIFIDYNENVIGQANFKNKKLTPQQKIEVAAMIADFIRSELTGGNVPKPAFISQVEITPSKDSRVDLVLAESFFTEAEFSKQLLDRIADKEGKADNYRKEVNVNLLWLLIVIDDVASFSGFNMESADITIIERSNFEGIFLFEKYVGKIHPIFPQIRVS